LPERRQAIETAGELVVRSGRPLTELAPAQRVVMLEKLLREAREQPGVQAESIASPGALLGVSLRDRLYSECTTCRFSLGYLPFAIVRVHMQSVGPDYFSLVGAPLLRGRDFTARDRIGASLVVIVNDAFVRSLFGPRGNGLGKVVRLSDGFGEAHRIVGVIADEVALAPGAPGAGQPVVYFSALQYPPRAFDLITRSTEEPAALAGSVEWSEPARLRDLRAAAVAPLNFASSGVRSLATLCFLLGAFGLYATISTLVSGRRRELGIRVALGSTAFGLLRHVTGYGLLLTFVGIVFGLAGSFAAQRILDEVLPSARIDAQSFLLATLALGLMVIAGVARPAWRSAREEHQNPLR
jgi:putative ABC transport system permease protein